MLKQLLHKGKERLRGKAVSAPELQPLACDNAYAVPPQEKIWLNSPVVAVLGAKGGAGATTVAINLAASLAAGGLPTTLVDSHYHQPDVATKLGLEPNHSMTELFLRLPEIDRRMFDACSVDVSGHLGLLSPPLDGAAGITTTLSALADCIDHIRSYSGFWVIDMYPHLDKHLVTLADRCQKILLVFESTLSGVAACKRWLTVFRDLGYSQDRVICVLNRSGAKPATVEEELAACFADQPLVKLPNAHSMLWDCTARGVTAVSAYPAHAYSKAMQNLAQLVYGSLHGGQDHV